MKSTIANLIREALIRLGDDALTPEHLPDPVPVESTRDASHGDLASNIALTLARQARCKPRDLAQRIVAALPESPAVQRVEIAGPGFINFHLAPGAYHAVLREVLDAGNRYGHSEAGASRRVLIEFVSANPTGPLHVGHGRHAAYGATVANLLAALGYEVQREYYVNDAGRQMDILAVSVWLRYLELVGEAVVFPANGYRGDYVTEIARKLKLRTKDALRRPFSTICAGLPPDETEGGDKEKHIDALIAVARETLGDDYGTVFALALSDILEDIRDDLAEFGVEFDRWFSERSLTDENLIARALERLEKSGQVYEKDGALWFHATEYGDEKDRVVRRSNGQTTYFASDIAYHLDKRLRGNDLLLDVLGSDHHGYVARVRAGLEAMGEPGESLEVRLMQFVALYRAGEKQAMSTRSGQFVTLRELRNEVGNDAARFFYVSRSNDQHLDFDLELAKSQSNDNPVYYVQYAHARVCSVFEQLSGKGFDWDAGRALANLDPLVESHELALMKHLATYGETLGAAGERRAPQLLVQYLRELANLLHTYYNAHQFLVDDSRVRDARLALIAATRQILANGLGLLGVCAPQSM